MSLLLFELQNTPQIRHLSPLHKGGRGVGCLGGSREFSWRMSRVIWESIIKYFLKLAPDVQAY